MAIERASTLRYNERKKENELKAQLVYFKEIESSQPGTFLNEIKGVKNELEAIDSERYRAAMIRARSEKLWAREALNKRALSDEKRYATKNVIKRIQYKNQITEDKEKIEAAFVEHYSELLGNKRRTEAGFMNNFLMRMPKLDDEVKQCLEQAISLKEINDAIDALSAGKSPGPDGLGVGFYKAFKRVVAPI